MRNEKFLYREVYQELKNKIEDGTLKPGEKLASEDELSAAYSVSKITTKRALDMLKDDGLIRRVQGRGTFVSEPEGSQPVSRPKEQADRRLIGLILEHVSVPFGLDMMYRISQKLDAAGYKICTRYTYGSAEKEAEEINSLLSLGISGLIIMPCHDSYYSRTILKLILENFPVVLVDKRMDGLPVNSVCTDGREAIRKLMHHLKEKGCENSAILTIDPSATTSLGDRAEGFYKGLEETGMRCAGEYIFPWCVNTNMLSYDEEHREQIGAILDGMQSYPDSFVCTEFALGRSLYAAAKQRGLEIGRDFMACSIDEDYLAIGGFRFTHMRQDEEAIADKTVKVLLGMLDGTYKERNDFRIPAIFRQGSTT